MAARVGGADNRHAGTIVPGRVTAVTEDNNGNNSRPGGGNGLVGQERIVNIKILAASLVLVFVFALALSIGFTQMAMADPQ